MRTFIVTGVSSGIGLAICERLLAERHQVIGLARNVPTADFSDPHYHAFSVDLAQLDELPDRLIKVAREFPNISGVICCAGVGRFGSLEEFSYGQIRALVELNLISQIYITRAFLPLMKRQGKGDLIFIGSEAAMTGGRRGAVYSATKFALRGLSQSLRQECAGSGVRVCIINPGMVKTTFFSELEFEPGIAQDNYLLPQDIADTVIHVLFLRQGSVVDEINLSPLKKVIRFKKPSKE